MHLLAVTPGVVSDGSEAVDLGQTPGDIVFLSAADTELAALAGAQARAGAGVPRLRLANFLQLGHHMSVDLYVENMVSNARLVIVRLLGGASYWPYGIEQIAVACRRRGIGFAAIPGDDQPDSDLTRRPRTCIASGSISCMAGLPMRTTCSLSPRACWVRTVTGANPPR
jgi:cobaltochelatase CobN